MAGDGNAKESKRRRRNRWGDAPTDEAAGAVASTASTNRSITQPSSSQDIAKAKALALQESIRQRLAALKSKQAGSTGAAAAPPNKRPLDSADDMGAQAPQQQQQPPLKKAKHFDLDMSITGPTYQEKPKPKVNPYLQHQEDDDKAGEMDERLALRTEKRRQRNKQMRFVEPGTFVEIAERKRQKALNAEASGFASGRKQGTYVKAADIANVYGPSTRDDESVVSIRADCDPDMRVPIVEWWDVELLPSKLKKQVSIHESKALSQENKAQLQHLSKDDQATTEESDFVELRDSCFQQASHSYSKTAALVQHIVPIETRTKPLPQTVLHLTQKERKRQRKLRRAERQRELQDLQAAGLVAAPDPRLTLKNFIQVMGDQAFVDPSQMEAKVREQMFKRQEAHLARNEASRLTKDQKSEKRARKLQEDTSESVTVALFYVKDMSHPYHRAKVELNARQFNITGGVLECEEPSLACVICEGGPKAIKKYVRLMTLRMKWAGTGDDDDDNGDNDEEREGEKKTHKFNPDNKCELVWTGMATRRLFKSFVFQSCETSDVARKVLKAKGVGHFWDQVLTHASGRGESFHLKLATSENEEQSDAAMDES